MTDLICGRYDANDIRARYTALDEVTSSLRRFQQDAHRDASTSCDSDLEHLRVAHSGDIVAFVEYMRTSFNDLEDSILRECGGTEYRPTDGEPFWRLRAYYTVTWTSSEPDGSTFQESDSNMEGEWFFRSEIEALEWTKYLLAKDDGLDVNAPRFIPNQEDYV